MMPRLLFAVYRWFPFGGMQRTMLRIAEACIDSGCEVTFLCVECDGEIPANIQVQRVPRRGFTNPGRMVHFGREFRKFSRDFDLVVGFNRLPGLDVYYAGDPCFAADLRRRPGFRRLFGWFRHRVYLQVEAAVFGPAGPGAILLIAHAEREKFIRHYGTALSRFHLLPPGIDRRRLTPLHRTTFDSTKFRHSLGVPADHEFLLTVGSGYRTKGVDRVLKAIAVLPERLRSRTTYVIVGEETHSERFRKLAINLGLKDQVIFCGARDDVGLFYRAADLLIHPARVENTGTSILEAMICGLPVVATANCGFAFHIQEAAAGVVVDEPFHQRKFDRMLLEALTWPGRVQWRKAALDYTASRDLEGLIVSAAEVILERVIHSPRSPQKPPI